MLSSSLLLRLKIVQNLVPEFSSCREVLQRRKICILDVKEAISKLCSGVARDIDLFEDIGTAGTGSIDKATTMLKSLDDAVKHWLKLCPRNLEQYLPTTSS